MQAAGLHPDPSLAAHLADQARRAIDALLQVAETTTDLVEKRRAATAVLRFLASPQRREPATRRAPDDHPASGAMATAPRGHVSPPQQPGHFSDPEPDFFTPSAIATAPRDHVPRLPDADDPLPPSPPPAAPPAEPPAPPPGRAESRLDRAERRRRVALERLQSLAGSPPPHDTS